MEAGPAPLAPDLERLIALQRRALRAYTYAAAGLLALGLVAVLFGLLLAGRGMLPLLAVGLLAAALAALPWREALERRDRADGLLVLQEEWAGLPPDDAPARARLLGLIERMFGPPGSGGTESQP